MSKNYIIASALFIALTLLISSGVSAQALTDDEMTRAIDLYDNGVRLYEEGLYELALLAWQEAFDISGQPLLLYNMVNANERLGNLEDALENLNVYRAYATSDERETLERRIRNLERRLQQQRDEEERHANELELLREAQGNSEVDEQDGQAEQSSEQNSPNNQLHQQTEMQRQPLGTTGQIVRYGGLGLAVVGFSMGTIYGLQAQGDRENALDFCSGGENQSCQTQASESIDLERSNALIADISFGVGFVGAIVAFTTFFRPKAEVNEELSVVPIFGSEMYGLQIGGRF